MYARAARSYAWMAKSNVTLMLRPRLINSSIAGTPSGVPGTLIITLGRARRSKRLTASLIVASVSRAKSGETSRLAKPSPPPVPS